MVELHTLHASMQHAPSVHQGSRKITELLGRRAESPLPHASQSSQHRCTATDAPIACRHEGQPHTDVHVSKLSINDSCEVQTHLPTLARLPATAMPLPLLRETITLLVDPTEGEAGAATKACVRVVVAAASSSSSALASAVVSLIFAAFFFPFAADHQGCKSLFLSGARVSRCAKQALFLLCLVPAGTSRWGRRVCASTELYIPGLSLFVFWGGGSLRPDPSPPVTHALLF